MRPSEASTQIAFELIFLLSIKVLIAATVRGHSHISPKLGLRFQSQVGVEDKSIIPYFNHRESRC